MPKLIIDIDHATLEMIRHEHELNNHYPRDKSTGAPEYAVKLIAEAQEIYEEKNHNEH